jgi:HD-GYP domain-containing protein (c-di-GMP phosphodiesterase class II)
MKLAAPVHHPDMPDQVLLNGGYVLEHAVLQRLKDLGISALFVDYPALEELDRHLAPYLSPTRQKLYSQIKQGIASSQAGTRAQVHYKDYCDTTRSMVETLLLQGKNPIFLDQMSRLGSDTVGHATAVAHLSLLLGIKLESYLIDQRKRLPGNRAKDVVSLGVAGMLHDIGKTELPESAAKAWETAPPETEGDLELYKSHVQRGYEKIRGEVEPTAAAAVLNHHQHFDGSGFPSVVHSDGASTRREGQQIHVFARILHVADLFDRLATTDTGARRTNLEVFFLMRTSCSGWCDPVILQVLQQIAPPFPPGCRVSLSDGSSAIVTQVDAIDPFKPVVRRINAELQLQGEAIPLTMRGAPSIVTIGRTQVRPLIPVAA